MGKVEAAGLGLSVAKEWGWGGAPALGGFKFPAGAKGADVIGLLISLSRCEAKGKGG